MPEAPITPTTFALADGYLARLRPFAREESALPEWERLFPGAPEGYAYHLAFADAGVDNFRTCLLTIEQAGETLAAIPPLHHRLPPGRHRPGPAQAPHRLARSPLPPPPGGASAGHRLPGHRQRPAWGFPPPGAGMPPCLAP